MAPNTNLKRANDLDRVGRSNPLMIMTLIQIGLLFGSQFLPSRFRDPIRSIVTIFDTMIEDEHATVISNDRLASPRASLSSDDLESLHRR